MAQLKVNEKNNAKFWRTRGEEMRYMQIQQANTPACYALVHLALQQAKSLIHRIWYRYSGCLLSIRPSLMLTLRLLYLLDKHKNKVCVKKEIVNTCRVLPALHWASTDLADGWYSKVGCVCDLENRRIHLLGQSFCVTILSWFFFFLQTCRGISTISWFLSIWSRQKKKQIIATVFTNILFKKKQFLVRGNKIRWRPSFRNADFFGVSILRAITKTKIHLGRRYRWKCSYSVKSRLDAWLGRPFWWIYPSFINSGSDWFSIFDISTWHYERAWNVFSVSTVLYSRALMSWDRFPFLCKTNIHLSNFAPKH